MKIKNIFYLFVVFNLFAFPITAKALTSEMVLNHNSDRRCKAEIFHAFYGSYNDQPAWIAEHSDLRIITTDHEQLIVRKKDNEVISRSTNKRIWGLGGISGCAWYLHKNVEVEHIILPPSSNATTRQLIYPRSPCRKIGR